MSIAGDGPDGTTIPTTAGGYRSLFDRLDLGVVYQAGDGSIIDANPAAERILGLTLEEMRGRTSMDPRWNVVREDGTLLPGPDHPAMIALRTGRDVRGALVGVSSGTDSQVRWLLVDAFPEFDPPRTAPARVFTTFTDVTERRQEEELAARWRQAFSQSRIAIALTDVREPPAFLAVNESFARQRGYRPDELVGRPVLDVHAPEDREEIRQRIQETAREGHVLFETFHQRIDGSRFPVLLELTLIRDAQGRPISAVAYALDLTEHKRAQAAERESESRSRRIAAAGHVGLWEWDLVTNRVYYSPEWKRQIGYEDEELGAGLDEWERRLHPDDARNATEAVRAYLESPVGPFESEFRFRHKDGSYRFIVAQGGVERDETGRMVRMLGTHMDMTEHRRAEQALLDSERTLRSLFDAIPESVVLIDREGTILAANETFARRLSTTVDALAGRNIFGLCPPDVAERRREWVRQVVQDGRVRVFEDDAGPVRLQHHVCPIVDPDGTTRRLVIFAVDVSDHYRLAAELRETSERYRQFVETSFNWVWEIDRRGRYTFVSDHVRKLLGYEPGEVLGRSPLDLMPEDESRRVAPVFNGAMHRREPFVAVENVARHKNGSLVVLETSGVPVYDHQGHYRGYRGMDRDVTARRQLEEQLRQSQKLEAIGQLAGGIAHDFNNILAAAMMHIGLLQANPDLDPDTRSGLADLEVETQRAATLTRQLLMFSRRAVLSVRTLDVNEVVVNLLKMLERIIGEQIDLRFRPQASLPAVEADDRLLEQVLVNLVVNARDAMAKGGRLTIATEAVEFGDDQPQGSGRRAGLFVRLSVEDTGCGMSEELTARIFEPFFTTKEAGKGTGLGLATAHGIMAQHDGWIEVESHVGRGSRFDLFLPARRTPAPASTVRGDTVASKGGTETILLVEDEPGLRRMAARTLARLGYHVLEAANGQEALAQWAAHASDIDVLFTDLIMPEGLTGLDLWERFRAAKPTLRTLLTSGYNSELVHSGVPVDAGVLYLPKPYNLAQLADAVRTCLQPR